MTRDPEAPRPAVREEDPDPSTTPTGPTGPTRPTRPTTPEAADRADKYDRMLRLADLFDATADDLRARARLGAEILSDPSVGESVELSRPTFDRAEADLRDATTGKHGLLTRGVELDADALMVRATVLTYRWIDELQEAAYQTLGAIAGRAIGYLAPEVALGGAVVSAGLIETDALDRDDVTAYLDELAQKNPELMDHVTSGGGGLLDGLRMRSLLTAGVLAGESGPGAAVAGLRAAGAGPLPADVGSALRDVAGGFVEPLPEDPLMAAAVPVEGEPPRGLEELMASLAGSPTSVHVQRIEPGRFIAYLTGPGGGTSHRLRLVGGDHSAYARHVVRAIEAAVATDVGDAPARVMLVGSAMGGLTAAEVASAAPSEAFVVDHVVTAGAPSAQVPRLPDATRMLALADRRDPVALLGSLVNAGSSNRVTVVFDGDTVLRAVDSGTSDAGDTDVYVAGARAADRAEHPDLVEELRRLREAGYLAG